LRAADLQALNRTWRQSKTNHAQAKTQMNPLLEPKSKFFLTSQLWSGLPQPLTSVNACPFLSYLGPVICLIDGFVINISAGHFPIRFLPETESEVDDAFGPEPTFSHDLDERNHIARASDCLPI